MSGATQRTCPIDQRRFTSRRRDAIYCSPRCRQLAHRRRHQQVPAEHPREAPEQAMREARERLRVLRKKAGLPELAASRRLDLEAGLQAHRLAVASYERVIDSAPPGPRYTTLVHQPEWLGSAEIEAAEFLGVGAARSVEGHTLLVLIVGATKLAGPTART